jgi:hypothetical protein
MSDGIRRMYRIRLERQQGAADVDGMWEDDWGEKNPLAPGPYGQPQGVGGRKPLKAKKEELAERR